MADDILKEAKDFQKDAHEKENENRKAFEQDIKFARMSEQWDSTVVKQRELEGRPCLTINKLQPVIRQVVNDARQNRPAIKVHPADDNADPETADLLSGLIRNIWACSDGDVAVDTAADCSVSGGFGYWRINIDYAQDISEQEDYSTLGSAAFEQDLVIQRVANPLSVYGDPHATAADSSDWMRSLVVEQMSHAQFKRKYPGAQKVDFEGPDWGDVSPPWKDADTVMVAEFWKRVEATKQIIGLSDGTVMLLDEFEKQRERFLSLGVEAETDPRPIKCWKVTQHIVSGAEELSKTDWAGKYIPIIPVYGDEVNVGGKRFFRSLIRDAKGAQQMYNFMRSGTAEMVALQPKTPFIGPKGAFKTDVAKWTTANRATHAFIEYDGQTPPQREQMPGIPAGLVNESQMASDDIKSITGIYDASLGARSNETSGKAIMARQREGDVSTFHFIDNLSRAIRHTGRVLIDLIPKVYSTERIIRILGEDGTPETRVVNPSPEKIEELQRDEQAKVRIHDLRVGKYDLTVSAGPSFTSRREEAAAQMTEVVRASPEIAAIAGDLIAKNYDWPGADEFADRIKAWIAKTNPGLIDDEEGEDPEKQALQQQIQQMAQAIEQIQKQAESIKEDKAVDWRKLDIDERKVEVEEYKAETERMGVVPIEQLPALMAQAVAQMLSDPRELPEREGDANQSPDEPVMMEQPY